MASPFSGYTPALIREDLDSAAACLGMSVCEIVLFAERVVAIRDMMRRGDSPSPEYLETAMAPITPLMGSVVTALGELHTMLALVGGFYNHFPLQPEPPDGSRVKDRDSTQTRGDHATKTPEPEPPKAS